MDASSTLPLATSLYLQRIIKLRYRKEKRKNTAKRQENPPIFVGYEFLRVTEVVVELFSGSRQRTVSSYTLEKVANSTHDMWATISSRNKELLISDGVIPLLEQMISNPSTEESAIALYLNLSSLEEAKPIIGSSPAIPLLVQLLQSDDPKTTSKHDALYTLYNLSTHPSNTQPLLNSGIITALHTLLAASSENETLDLVEKTLTILINLASSKAGSNEIVSTPGLIAALATVLDIGELPEQEQVVSCMLILCSNSESCSEVVLEEGVIPGLVLVSANGSERGREKAQRLLKFFREQRKEEDEVEVVVAVVEPKPFCKTRSTKFGRSISSMWKKKISVSQC